MAGTPRFVFASESLKGTIASVRAGQLLEAAARRHFPQCECRCIPMADGGDGTAEAVSLACGGELKRACVHDPWGAPLKPRMPCCPMAAPLWRWLLPPGCPCSRPARRTRCSRVPTVPARLIHAALDAGARDVTLAIGGSATNDGGMGCMHALGARFLDARGREAPRLRRRPRSRCLN